MGRPNVNWTVGSAVEKSYVYGNRIIKAGIPFAQQVTEPDMKYIIKYDFSLGGESVEIPENCILEFQGGSVSNGTLVGDGTQIYAEKVAIFSEITIDGEWNVPQITTAWFKEAGSEDDVLKEVFNLLSETHYNELTVELGDYWVNVYPDKNGTLPVTSNTKLIVLGNIRLRGHSYRTYKYTISISNKTDIVITGGGCIYGDREYHDFSDQGGSHESCHVIMINESKNITFDGINIKDGTGDGIDITHAVDGNNDRIVLRNFTIDNCRRQGITAGGTNIVIENGRITNIKGTLPEAAIDIEISTNAAHENKRCLIRNLYIENCYQGILVTSSSGLGNICGLVNIDNVEAYNVGRGIVASRFSFNVHVSNCKFTIIPRRTPGIWPNEYGDSQTYTFNTLQGWASTIEGCRFIMEGEIPEWAESEFTMLSTRYASLTHYMSVIDSYFECPLINACYIGYRSVFSGNTIQSNRFVYDGSNDRAKIIGNNIETGFLSIEGALFSNNIAILAGPMYVGNFSLVHDNRFAFNISEYDFGDSPKHLFRLYGRANIHHNLINPGEGTIVDTIFYHNTANYTNWITDNRFSAAFEYDEVISGTYSKKDIMYNNYINKGSIENADNSHPGSPRLSSSVTLNSNALLFYSLSGRTASPISSSGGTSADKSYVNLNHKLIPNVLYYTGETVPYSSGVTSLNEEDVWTKNVVVDLRYSLNFSTNLSVGSPVYLVANYNSEAGSYKFVSDPIYSQSLPTTSNGKIYIYLGMAVSTTEVMLAEENHMYVYDESLVKLVV